MRKAASLLISALLMLSGCAAGSPLVTPADHPASPQAAAAPRAGHPPYHYQLQPDPPELTAPQSMGHGGIGHGTGMPPDQPQGHKGMSHD